MEGIKTIICNKCPPVINAVVTGLLEASPHLEMRDTLYLVSGFRPSIMYCLSGGEISTVVWSDRSELGM